MELGVVRESDARRRDDGLQHVLDGEMHRDERADAPSVVQTARMRQRLGVE